MRFDSCHPAVSFLFFLSVFICIVNFSHPVYIAVSLVCGMIYIFYLKRRRALFPVCCSLLFIPFYTWWYSLYHHFGVTPIRANFIGNQLTVESVARGLAIACAVSAAVMWAGCFHEIFSSDKVIYLFGRIWPFAGLMISSLLRTVPRISERFDVTGDSLSGIGKGPGDGNIIRRIRNYLRIVSGVVTWYLEDLTDRGSSMRSRGYGTGRRTAYSVYRFDNRDRVLVIVFALLIAMTSAAAVLDQTDIYYDPQIIINPVTAVSWIFYIAYAVYLLLPMAVQVFYESRFARTVMELE